MGIENLHPINSPMPTPSKEVIIIDDSISEDHKRKLNDEQSPTKRLKLSTPDASFQDDNDDDVVETVNLLDQDEDKDNIDSANEFRELKRREKQVKKEQEKKAKEERKEAERKDRELKKEEERRQRDLKKEEDRRQKELKKEEEKKQKELKKAEERRERELKKEEERKERELKKEEERKERELKKEEERKERELKKEEERRERELRKEEEKRAKEEIELKKKKEIEAKQHKIAKQQISNFFKSNSKAPKIETVEKVGSLFEKQFLSFYVKNNVVMASDKQLSNDELSSHKAAFDDLLSSSLPSLTSGSFFAKEYVNNSNYNKIISPEDVVSAIENNSPDIFKLINMLGKIKYIQFYELEKPPYVGTWCSLDHRGCNFPLLNPFDKGSTNWDYDYDSDLDWREEEGDDLENDDDEEEEEDEENDMDDFVEANDTESNKFIGKLKPVCYWNDGQQSELFNSFKYERLHINIRLPIDPSVNHFKSNEVEPTPEVVAVANADTTASSPQSSILPPNKQIITDKKVVYDLAKFIEANNDFSIGTLVELSKKSFNDFTKALLKKTIQEIANYNKKSASWEVKPEVKLQIYKLFD